MSELLWIGIIRLSDIVKILFVVEIHMKKARDFWTEKHKNYSLEKWIDRSSKFAEQVLEYFPEKGKILDLAAGQGQDSRYFARQGYDVWCTDFNEFALTEAKKKSESNVSMHYLMVDIGKDLPFETKSFDVVYSHMGLHFFDRKNTRRLFAEIHRVLDEGGVLATLFNTVNDPEINNNGMTKIESNFYKSDAGLTKSYFSVDYVKDLVEDLFDPILLDEMGETYKDKGTKLIRFVGVKK